MSLRRSVVRVNNSRCCNKHTAKSQCLNTKLCISLTRCLTQQFLLGRWSTGPRFLFFVVLLSPVGFPGGASSIEPACPCRRCKRCRLDPWVRKIPQRKHGNPLQYSCLENLHGQRSLVGYSPQGGRVGHD